MLENFSSLVMCTLLIILFTLVTLVSFKKGFLFKLQIKIVPRAVGISISSHTHTLYDFNQAFLCQITPEFDVSPSQGYHSVCQGQVSELHKIIENWKTLMILGLITLSHSSPPPFQTPNDLYFRYLVMRC